MNEQHCCCCCCSDDDEESTLSSLLGELDDLRNNAMLDDAGDDLSVDMDETVDVPPPKSQGVSERLRED